MQNFFWQAVTLGFPISISTPEFLNSLTPVSLAYGKQNFPAWRFLPIIRHLQIEQERINFLKTAVCAVLKPVLLKIHSNKQMKYSLIIWAGNLFNSNDAFTNPFLQPLVI